MKKFTKILSLALALALVLSTTAFAETVYYANDFNYESLGAALADMTGSTTNSVPNAIANATVMSHSSSNGGTLDTTKSVLSKDSSGLNWFKFNDVSSLTTVNGTFYVYPDNAWDYTSATGMNETYIISLLTKFDPKFDFGAAKMERMEVTWTTDGASPSGDRAFAFRREDGEDHVRVWSKKQFYETVSNTAHGVFTELTNNVPYKVAAGYTYAEGKTFAPRTMAINGVITAVTTSGTGGNNKQAGKELAGFNLNYSAFTGQALSSIKMYTIKNNEALNALDVEGFVPTTNASVTVKFSLPVGALDKSAVTIDGLVNGTDFTVSDVKDVVTSNDVYSTVTLNFTKALEGSTTYTINFPATTTNEIGTAIADTTATFTTDKNPTYILALEGYEGLAAGTTQIAADAMAGKTVYFKATATNDTGRATSGVLAIGIYEGENLVKYAFANKTFATDGAVNTFSAAFKLEAGQTAKAFVTGSESVKVFGE